MDSEKILQAGNHKSKILSERIAFGIFRALSGVIVTILFVILAFIIIKGIGVLNWDFITTPPTDGMKGGGVWPAIVGTFYLMVGSALFAFPSQIHPHDDQQPCRNPVDSIRPVRYVTFRQLLRFRRQHHRRIADTRTSRTAARHKDNRRSPQSHTRQFQGRQPCPWSDQTTDNTQSHPADGHAKRNHGTDTCPWTRIRRNGAYPLHMRSLFPPATSGKHIRPMHGSAIPPIRARNKWNRYGKTNSDSIRHGVGACNNNTFRQLVGQRPAQLFPKQAEDQLTPNRYFHITN